MKGGAAGGCRGAGRPGDGAQRREAWAGRAADTRLSRARHQCRPGAICLSPGSASLPAFLLPASDRGVAVSRA